MSKSDVTNWAVLGVGKAGSGHIRRIRQTGGMRLAGVCDAVTASAQQRAEELHVHCYPTIEALGADEQIQGVTIATPSALHAEQAVRLLEAGKHVLVEKPLALDEAEARSVANAAAAADRLALPYHNRKWDPDYRLVREVVDSGRLGAVQVVQSAVGGAARDQGWRRQQRAGGGRLNDWGPHLFSQIYDWFGGQAKPISGQALTVMPGNECDDLFTAELLGPGPAVIQVMMSGISFLPPMRWQVLGSEGTLQLTGNIHGAFILRWQRGDGEQFERTYQRSELIPDGAADPIYSALAAHWQTGADLPVSTEEAIHVARWMQFVREGAVEHQLR